MYRCLVFFEFLTHIQFGGTGLVADISVISKGVCSRYGRGGGGVDSHDPIYSMEVKTETINQKVK